ncbi:AMP-binding protein [Dehalogenimonas sp. THU2]|uniref:class I adenylate-forming enzyme family protein n=1 Tax=Dehalogenimonas sp. THU2 TaxID=3151121 RepID=UPI0032189007
MTLTRFLAEAGRRHQDRIAFQMGERQLSFKELDRLSNGLAESLVKMGIKPGEHVALLLENSPDFVISYFGVVKAGAIAMPLDTKYKLLELTAVFDDCRPVALIAETAALKALSAVPSLIGSFKYKICLGNIDIPGCVIYDSQVKSAETAPLISEYPELAHIAYTSGPTLRPHGAEIKQRNLIEAAAGSAAGFGQTDQDTVALFALPLHHTIGIAVIMMTSLFAGSRVVIVNGISMDALLCSIEKERVTMFHGVPFIHAMMVNHLKANGLKYDISSLRFCGSAGAPIPVSVITGFEELTGKYLNQYYGLTESTSHVTCQELNKSGDSGGVGTSIPGFEVRVVNEEGRTVAAGEPGEVVIRGPIMRAYHNRVEDTERFIRDGWLYTDDIGIVDENGELFITGVKKPMLITKGQNIYFSDIADILITHPLIADAAAGGIPDPDGMRGEVVLAVVTLIDGANLTEQEVKKFCLERLANYKCPKKVLFVSDIPRSPNGQLATFSLLE